MKKLVAVGLVIVSLLAMGGVAAAEHGDIGGIGVKNVKSSKNM